MNEVLLVLIVVMELVLDVIDDWLLPLIALIGIVLAFMVVSERVFLNELELDSQTYQSSRRCATA